MHFFRKTYIFSKKMHVFFPRVDEALIKLFFVCFTKTSPLFQSNWNVPPFWAGLRDAEINPFFILIRESIFLMIICTP